ncbi:ABC transporter ATP-binding protein/permease [Streptomyces mutabilis]|uniref:ABC transporter ATP-binding protein n=1 Tax=Streptomyces mutabilis TaxID=67332 RepID=UPI0022BA6EEB|nr:ABC transporter ATP-binding protein [Streptomyces mutabilis]MCZ9351177.1 ABC transporter ATP-binding protein/permease [Streptomyces mutabilis]
MPWTLSAVVTALVQGEPVTGALTALASLTLTASAAQAGCGRLLANAGERVALDLRARVTRHTLCLPLADVRARGAGDLGARIIHDTGQVRVALESGMVHLPAAAFGVIAVLAALAYLDPQLTLVALATFVLVGVPLAGVLARTRRVATARMKALGRLNQRLHSCLQTLTLVKTCRYEATATAAVGLASADYGHVSAAASRLQAAIGPLVGLAQQAAMVALTVTAAHRIGEGTLSPKTFGTCFFLLLCLASPLTVLVLGAGQLRAGQAARDRLDELLSLPVEAEVPRQPGFVRRARVPSGDGVAFRQVTFAHPDSGPVLRELSFTVPAVGLSLLVGPSGAGKSTVFALITRLLLADHGDIEVLGEEVGSWRLSQLRRRVAHVDQQAVLWEGTVRDNLRMGGDPHPSDDQLWDALDTVELRGTVERFPQGLDAPLGSGRPLSGGQCQRLSMARAAHRRRSLPVRRTDVTTGRLRRTAGTGSREPLGLDPSGAHGHPSAPLRTGSGPCHRDPPCTDCGHRPSAAAQPVRFVGGSTRGAAPTTHAS